MVSRITNGRSLMVRLNLLILAVAAAPEVPQVDEDRGAAQADLYPTLAWACVGGFIAFVSVCHLFSLFSLPWRRVPLHSAASRNRDVIHIRRLPAALTHTFRVIAFRWTISLGDSFTLNLAELFMTAGYIAILFSWALVNCRLHLLLLLVIGGLILGSQ
jgi:ferric-chelate reductase